MMAPFMMTIADNICWYNNLNTMNTDHNISLAELENVHTHAC